MPPAEPNPAHNGGSHLWGERLRRSDRLSRPSEFQDAYGQNCRYFGAHMVMFVRRGAGAALRLGVVASRRVGGAVARNRARRLLREVFRRERSSLTPGVDIVLVARGSASKPTFIQLREEFRSLARRAGLWTAPGQEGRP